MEVVEQGPVRTVVRVKKASANRRSSRISFFTAMRTAWISNFAPTGTSITASPRPPSPSESPSAFATYEIPFGSIQRFDYTFKEDPNTRLEEPARGWEIADRTKFEVAAQRWADVTDRSGSYGVSLLNDSKYGFSFQQNVLRMSLVRGPRRGYPATPDSWSDQSDEPLVGIHQVKYALVPHRGGWQEAGATRRGIAFNAPFLVKFEPSHAGELSGHLAR